MVNKNKKKSLWVKVLKAVIVVALAVLGVHSTDTGSEIINAVTDVAVEVAQ